MHIDDIRNPWAMRLSKNEYRIMKARADKLGLTVPALIRLLVLHESVDEQIDNLLNKKQQLDTGAKILALLGKQQHANNINQISKSLHCGTFVETPTITTQIDEYGEMLALIREHQMKMQGVRRL